MRASMKGVAAATGFGLAAAVSLGWAGGAEAQDRNDRQVCYETEEYGNTRIVLDVKFHSYLPVSSYAKRRSQSVWDADGKHAFTEGAGKDKKNRMAVADGAVVVSAGDQYQPKGAHMGLESLWVRGAAAPAPQGGPTKPIDWDCTSDEASPTPRTWYCSILTEQDGRVLPATLVRLDRPDQHCDVFQDTK